MNRDIIMNRVDSTVLYISIATASHIYGIKEQTLRKWLCNGSLPKYKVNGFLVLIKISDLEALIVIC